MEIASPLFVVSYYPREEIWRLTGKRNDGIRRLSCLQKPRNWYVVSDSGTKKLCCKHANKSQQQPSFQKRIGDWVIVQEDEDIRTFAARFHVTPESLRIANGLDSAQVKLKYCMNSEVSM